jgi:hypothetical protein
MPDKDTAQKNHVATRAKKEQRGFYYERQPGFYDVKGTFDRAAEKANGNAKTAGYLAALAKFGFLLDHPDPVAALGEHFQASKDRFAKIDHRRAQGTRIFQSEGPVLGPQSTADRVVSGWRNQIPDYGGV